MRKAGYISLASAGCALALLALSSVPNHAPRLVYNKTPSVPVGWYIIDPSSEYARGDLVLSQLPDPVQSFAFERGYLGREIPVLKTIWGVGGDRICVSPDGVWVEGQDVLPVVSIDSAARKMPLLEHGCSTIQVGHVFLASDRSLSSFDSRYFGSIPEGLLVGQARFVGSADSKRGWNSGYLGGARGRGAECKIKGRSAAAGLTPCLHIIFYSAAEPFTALPYCEYCNEYSGVGPRYRHLRPVVSRGPAE